MSKVEKERPPPTGCMSSMLKFIDLRRLLFSGVGRRTTSASSPQPEQQLHQASRRKGVEAPRNSLELDEPGAAIIEQYYGVPLGIQIARRPSTEEELLEEEKRKAEALTPRNRSIVAQLMGLEVLQYDISAPVDSFSDHILTSKKLESSVKKKKNKKKKKEELMQELKGGLLQSPRLALRNLNPNISGSISLPETPRASTERARDTDPGRFSLQLNKENNGYTMPEFAAGRSFPVSPTLRDSKKVMTKKENYFSSMEESKSQRIRHSIAREIVKEMKGSRIHKRDACITEKKCFGEDIKPSNSSSKAVEFLETRKKMRRNPPSASLPPINLLKPKANNEAKALKMEIQRKCKKASYERFTERIKRSTDPQLPLIINKKFSEVNTNYNEANQLPGPTPAEEQEPEKDPEFKYVKAILARAGVVGAKALKWFSPSLPIDPTIFHVLEPRGTEKAEVAASRPGTLRHRSNRKLLFHLVEEIVGDLLLSEPNRWRQSDGEDLLLRLWSRIKGFPTADCRIVGDIDPLVAEDLPESKVRGLLLHPSVVAAAQKIASEIELDILHSLVGEIFM